MSCLVLAACVNYHNYVARPFVESLLKTGYDDDYKVLKWRHPVKHEWPVDIYRLHLFLAYLQKFPKKYDTVIIFDIRDIVFQKDPRGIKHSELDCYLEDDSMTIGSCPLNSKGIRDSYGEDALGIIKDKPISCSGTMIGTQQGIEYYLRSVIDEATRMGFRYWGAHQWIHNYLIHSDKLKCRLVGNDQGDIYTVGYVPGILVKDHLVYDRKGQVPYVVHQYDRHVAMINDYGRESIRELLWDRLTWLLPVKY